MKNNIIVLSTILLFVSQVLLAQQPKKEFLIELSEKNMIIKPGQSKKIEVTINRSKSYQKTAIVLELASSLPEGVSASFQAGVDPLVNQILIVTVSENVQPVTKTLILKGKSSRSSKGIMLNLEIPNQMYSAN